MVEDNSPFWMHTRKKKRYRHYLQGGYGRRRVGDASPGHPHWRQPNANWIRAQYGSKSVSLGNIINAVRPGASKFRHAAGVQP